MGYIPKIKTRKSGHDLMTYLQNLPTCNLYLKRSDVHTSDVVMVTALSNELYCNSNKGTGITLGKENLQKEEENFTFHSLFFSY